MWSAPEKWPSLSSLSDRWVLHQALPKELADQSLRRWSGCRRVACRGVKAKLNCELLRADMHHYVSTIRAAAVWWSRGFSPVRRATSTRLPYARPSPARLPLWHGAGRCGPAWRCPVAPSVGQWRRRPCGHGDPQRDRLVQRSLVLPRDSLKPRAGCWLWRRSPKFVARILSREGDQGDPAGRALELPEVSARLIVPADDPLATVGS
jgi:hypothetical protein